MTAAGSCYTNTSVTPEGQTRQQMLEFIALLEPRGETSFQKGLCKAVEMLNNQDSKTRHHSESIDAKSIVQYVNHLSDLSITMNCP